MICAPSVTVSKKHLSLADNERKFSAHEVKKIQMALKLVRRLLNDDAFIHCHQRY